MDTWLKRAGVIAGLVVGTVSGVWGGLLALDGRYTLAADFRQQMSGVTQALKEGQIQLLERERFEFAERASKRPLTDMEQRRYLEVQEQLKRLRLELARGRQ